MAAMTPAFPPCSKRIFPTGLALVWACVRSPGWRATVFVLASSVLLVITWLSQSQCDFQHKKIYISFVERRNHGMEVSDSSPSNANDP